MGTEHLRPPPETVLQVRNLTVAYGSRRRGRVHAVSDVSFDLAPGETLGLVGESGCGKSTAARAVVQMPTPTGGSVVLDGVELTQLRPRALRGVRKAIQLIFQDPISSLNPQRTVFDIVMDPLQIWRVGTPAERRAAAAAVLEEVGLDPKEARLRRAAQYSGGQCQRIAIARALVLGPQVLICDEPVSSLDVSVQAQILNLLEDLKVDRGLSMVFVSHDLSVIRAVSDRLAVMYLGRLCEIGAPTVVYANPRHPYTAALLAAVPPAHGATARDRPSPLAGELPSPLDPPSGCRFRTRCPRADEICATDVPEMERVGDDHFVACHHPLGGTVPEPS